MTTMGRVFGHAFGIFFLAMGVGFLAIALYDPWSDWLDENSTCDDGDCSNVGASTTFLILGASFVATGLISSVVTEVAIRKTRRAWASVTTAQAGASFETMDGVADFLAPFGIKLDGATNANVDVQHRTIDLRGQRGGRELPRDPAGLSEYLKSVGVQIDEDVLRNATIVEGGEVVQAGTPRVEPASDHDARDTGAELRRERATIVRKKDRGATAGGQRLVEFELEVQPVGKVPYRVEVASLVRDSLAGLLIEGSTLNVRVDPGDENAVTIDWSEN